MADENDEHQDKTKKQPGDVRCPCGALVARQTLKGVELHCRRCKRVIVVRLPKARPHRPRGGGR